MLAVGFKQSIVGGLVFGAVLLVGSAVARQLPCASRPALCGRRSGRRRRAGGWSSSAWALAAGVRLETLWYTSVSFRSDANRMIADAERRGRDQPHLGAAAGVRRRRHALPPRLLRGPAARTAAATTRCRSWRSSRCSPSTSWPWPSAAATGCPTCSCRSPALALALAALMSHGQLGPPLAPGDACGGGLRGRPRASSRWSAGPARGSSAGPGGGADRRGDRRRRRPGDRVLVYGGRADIQWASRAGLALPPPVVPADAHPRPRAGRTWARCSPATTRRRGSSRRPTSTRGASSAPARSSAR